jgi:hypothetical protein
MLYCLINNFFYFPLISTSEIFSEIKLTHTGIYWKLLVSVTSKQYGIIDENTNVCFEVHDIHYH